MSSEAITQNDLREILSRTVGSIPSEYKKLLWTNPSPTANFSAQTISLDLSNYDDIEVIAKHWTNNDTVASSRCGALELGCVLIPNGSNSHMAYRDWQGYADHIYIAGGRDINGASITNTDYAGIPLQIYGIKYERVQPPQTDAFIFENYTDGLGYTVGAGATRDVTFTAPTKAGYTLKQVSCLLNQNYASVGVALISGTIHISLHNYLSASNDIGITLQYVWEHN